MTGEAAPTTLRIDKWLWQARFFKTRTLAAKAIASGPIRVNRMPVAKPGYSIRVGDVLTFAQGKLIRVIEVAALGARRGPAPEAQMLYKDLDPPAARAPKPDAPPPVAEREAGAGRPTKKDRRDTDKLRDPLY